MIRVSLEFKVGWFIMSCSKETLSLLTIWISRRVYHKRQDYLPFASTWVHSRFLAGSVLLISLVFCVVLHFYFLFICALCLLRLMLSVSLDCPFLITPLDFSNLYLFSADVIIYCITSNHTYQDMHIMGVLSGSARRSSGAWTIIHQHIKSSFIQ